MLLKKRTLFNVEIRPVDTIQECSLYERVIKLELPDERTRLMAVNQHVLLSSATGTVVCAQHIVWHMNAIYGTLLPYPMFGCQLGGIEMTAWHLVDWN